MDLEKRKVVMEEKEKIDEFVRVFSQSTIDAGDPRSILDSMEGLEGTKVREKVIEYLDAAEAEV